MNEEIMEREGGLLAGTTAAGLDQRAINLVAGLPAAPVAAAKKRQFGPGPVYVAHIAAGWDRMLPQQCTARRR